MFAVKLLGQMLQKPKELQFVQIVLQELFNSNETLIPISTLDLIAKISYDMQSYRIHDFKIRQQYETLIVMLIQELKSNDFERLKKVLFIIDYLLKYGSSACIDDFKEQIQLFKNIVEKPFKQNNPLHKEGIDRLALFLVKFKASHITMLLINRQQLYKEKEIAMSVKRKLQENSSGICHESASETKENERAESMLYRYFDAVSARFEDFQASMSNKIDELASTIKRSVAQNSNKNDDDLFSETCIDIEKLQNEKIDLPFYQSQKQQQSDLMQFKEQENKQTVDLLDL